MTSRSGTPSHCPTDARPGGAGAEPTLSLCMIVRDAERSLRQALHSARPFVDEMVVVDTGSRDRTMEIAREAGARVCEFAWCDDFSAARNHSLQQARCDWIFWMDADDELPQESGQEIRELIARHLRRDAAFWVAVEQQSQTSTGELRTTRHGHIKLFPRDPQIRFRYRVHEQVAPAIKELGLQLHTTAAVVRHAHADRSAEANAARTARNLKLLNLDRADHPDDPFVLLGLALAWLELPDGVPQAIDYAQQSLAGFKPGSPTRTNAYLALAVGHRRQGDHQAELATYQAACGEAPDDAAMLFRMGCLYEQLGDLARAAQTLERCLQAGKLHVSVVHFADVPRRAALKLGQIYIRLGRRGRAERLWRQFLEQRGGDDAVRAELQRSLLETFTITVHP